jgi:glutamate carboxypeptidase
MHSAGIVKNNLPGTQATVTFQNAIPAMPPSTANLNLLKQYSQISADLGYGAVHPTDLGARGAADISHVANVVTASLSGLGPAGYGSHSTQETLETNTLAIATERAALLIYRLTH